MKPKNVGHQDNQNERSNSRKSPLLVLAGLTAFVFISFNFACIAFGQEEQGDPADPIVSEVVISTPENSTGNPAQQTEQPEPEVLTVIYSGSNIPDDDIVAPDAIVADVRVPERPRSEDFEKLLSSMSAEDLSLFHRKRRTYLAQFISSLRSLRLSVKLTQRAADWLNDLLYQSAPQIAISNAVGGTVGLSLSGGLALPKRMTARIRETKWGQALPHSGGFFLRLAIGSGLTRAKLADGRSTWTFEAFVDVHRLKETLTGLGTVSGEINSGPVFQRRDENFGLISRGTSFVAGGAGVFMQTPEQVSFVFHPGISFPPIIASAMIFKNNFTRIYLLRWNFSRQWITAMANWVGSLRRQPRRVHEEAPGSLSCHDVFSGTSL